jgi:PAS domain S-box-containing protein
MGWEMFWFEIIIWILLVGGMGICFRRYYRRQMTKSLFSLENRYKPIMELTNQLFYEWDLASGKMEWAGAIENLTGYTQEEFNLTDIVKWKEMIHPEDRKNAVENLYNARSQFAKYRADYRFFNKNGGYNYVEDEGNFFRDEGGQNIRMLGTIRDISERKKSEWLLQKAHKELQNSNTELERRVQQRTSELTAANQKLLKSEERFRTIFEYVTIGMCVRSIEGRYLVVNRSLCAMFGYSEEELLTLSYFDLICPEDAQYLSQKLEELLAGKQSAEIYEVRFRHKNGQTVWALVGNYLLHDSAGHPQHFIAHLQDITRRKRDETQFKRLYAAIEQIADGVIITNPKGVIEYVNPAFGHVTGYASDEAVGMEPHFFDRDRKNNAVYTEIRDTLITGTMWTGRLTHDKKGELVLMEASISPIYGAKGQNIGYVAIIRDITDKQRLENRLKQAQKMEAIGTLAGGIAHDFNNILGGIIGCSEMALLEISPESIAYSDLEKVVEAGMRAKRLIKQILMFSRQSESEMVPLNLSAFLKETINFLRASFSTNIDIRLNIPQKIGAILADPVQMQQVMMNLFVNAQHAMQTHGGILEVTLGEITIGPDENNMQTELKPGDYVQLTVGDTGRGIRGEIIERIFDPFFTTKKVGEGTGLGLSVVHGIVKKHGGTITAYSQLGRGAIFHVFIPLLKEGAVESHKPHRIDMAPLPKGNERILLVDDERLLFDVIPRMLTELGYKIVAKSSGTEAYRVFQDKPESFDLVITDQTMPDMTGIMLSKKIKQLRSDIRIILCIGFSQTLTSNQLESYGIMATLHKPIVRADIAHAIRRVLSQ